MNLILEIEALSQNDSIFGTNQGASRFQYKSFRDQITRRILAGVGSQSEDSRTAWSFKRFWGAGKSQFDEANLIGGFKPIVDSMTKIGLIADDNPDLFKAYYFQQKSKTGEGYIQIKKLNSQEELLTAFQKLAETFEIKEETLIRIANEADLLIKEIK